MEVAEVESVSRSATNAGVKAMANIIFKLAFRDERE
jgi:hypothetical protein